MSKAYTNIPSEYVINIINTINLGQSEYNLPSETPREEYKQFIAK
jgi:hypothetical protein